MLRRLPTRTLSACWNRAKYLGVNPSKQSPWTAKEDKTLIECKQRNADINEILMLVPDRSPGACKARIVRLLDAGADKWTPQDWKAKEKNGTLILSLSNTPWSKEEMQIMVDHLEDEGIAFFSLIPGHSTSACATKRTILRRAKKAGTLENILKNTPTEAEIRKFQESQDDEDDNKDSVPQTCGAQPQTAPAQQEFQQLTIQMNEVPKPIEEWEAAKAKPSEPWDEEDDDLVRLFFNRNKAKLMQCLPGKTLLDCWVRADALGVVKDSGKDWTAEEDAKLFALRDSSIEELLETFEARSPDACKVRLESLIKAKKGWSQEDNDTLLRFYYELFENFKKKVEEYFPFHPYEECRLQLRKLLWESNHTNGVMPEIVQGAEPEQVPTEDILPNSSGKYAEMVTEAQQKEAAMQAAEETPVQVHDEQESEPVMEEPATEEPELEEEPEATITEPVVEAATDAVEPEANTTQPAEEIKEEPSQKDEKKKTKGNAPTGKPYTCFCTGCKPVNEERAWIPAEEKTIKRLYDKSFSIISKHLPDRSCYSCYQKALELGITKSMISPDWEKHIRTCWNKKSETFVTNSEEAQTSENENVWTSVQDLYIRQTYLNDPDATKRLLPKKSRLAIYNRAVELGLAVPEKHQMPWTRGENTIIQQKLANGIDGVVEELGIRTAEQILLHAKACGFIRNATEEAGQTVIASGLAWSDEEEATLKEHIDDPLEVLQELIPTRTPSAINGRRRLLRIRMKKEEQNGQPTKTQSSLETSPETSPKSPISSPEKASTTVSSDSSISQASEPNPPEKPIPLISALTPTASIDGFEYLMKRMDLIKWTEEEDALILKNRYNLFDCWKEDIPDKTKAQCAYRLRVLLYEKMKEAQNVLNPAVWTPRDDLALILNEGRPFNEWQGLVKNRTEEECEERAELICVNFAKSNIPSYETRTEVAPWTEEEDTILLALWTNSSRVPPYSEWGDKFPDRSKAECLFRISQLGYKQLVNEGRAATCAWTDEENYAIIYNDGRAYRDWKDQVPDKTEYACKQRAMRFNLDFEDRDVPYPSVPVFANQWTWNELQSLIKKTMRDVFDWMGEFPRHGKVDCCVQLALQNYRKLVAARAVTENTWTPGEDATLIVNEGVPYYQWKHLIPNRTEAAVKLRVNLYGLKLNMSAAPWNEEEDAILKANSEKPYNKWFQLIPNHTYADCRSRAKQLGINFTDNSSTWTEEEDAILKKNWNKPYDEWKDLLPKRNRKNCLDRMVELGEIEKGEAVRWTKEEDAIIISHQNIPYEEWQHLLPNRNMDTCRNRARRVLNVPFRHGYQSWLKEEVDILVKNIKRPYEEWYDLLPYKDLNACRNKASSLGYKLISAEIPSPAWTEEDLKILQKIATQPYDKVAHLLPGKSVSACYRKLRRINQDLKMHPTWMEKLYEEAAERSKNPENLSKPWTDAEEQALKRGCRRPIKNVSPMLYDRTISACFAKISSLNLKGKIHSSWKSARTDEKTLRESGKSCTIGDIIAMAKAVPSEESKTNAPEEPKDKTYHEPETQAITEEELRRLMKESSKIDF